MNETDLAEYMLTKRDAVVEHPHGNEVKAFKVCNKIFGLIAYDEGVARINLKCDADEAIELRDQYESIVPGYQMNKKLWNTIFIDGSIPDELFIKMIDDSYDSVVNTLPSAKRNALGYD